MGGGTYLQPDLAAHLDESYMFVFFLIILFYFILQCSFVFCTSLSSAGMCFLLLSVSEVQPVLELTVTYLL